MTRYVGYCYDSGAWGGDLTGQLICEEPEGWVGVAGHISSDVMWSERDIRRHFDDRRDPSPDDTFDWIGRVQTEADLAAYPAKPGSQRGER